MNEEVEASKSLFIFLSLSAEAAFVSQQLRLTTATPKTALTLTRRIARLARLATVVWK